MAILTKFVCYLMNHIIREYAGKKIKSFLNDSPLTVVNLLLSPFKVSTLYVSLIQRSNVSFSFELAKMRHNFAGFLLILIFCNSSFLIQACKISIKVPYLPNASERRQYRDAYYGYKENSKSPPSGGKNWMSRVSNNVRLSELTIPGTHDSAAIYGKSSTSIVRY